MDIYDILNKIMSYLWVYMPRWISDINVQDELPAHNYVELDHNLVPRKIADINAQDDLPGRVKPDRDTLMEPDQDTLMVNK